MHVEIRREAPGRCPKCGMALVRTDDATTEQMTGTQSRAAVPPARDRGLGTLTWQNYLPLITIILLILAACAALSWRDYGIGQFSLPHSIAYFMTGFFLVFSGFKLLDMRGFAEGYSTYDILAQKVFAYGYLYPFIELTFGLAMLAGFKNPALLWFEVAVMGFSGLGVLIKVLRREPVKCVCLGTILKVPLTTVTLAEDFGMAALALILILFT